MSVPVRPQLFERVIGNAMPSPAVLFEMGNHLVFIHHDRIVPWWFM
jgi:hypothetical protein